MIIIGQGFDTDSVHLVKILSRDLQAPGGPPVTVTAYTADTGIWPGSPEIQGFQKARPGFFYTVAGGQWVSAP